MPSDFRAGVSIRAVRKIQLYDTTLRDGTQAEDVAFTLEDKLRVAEQLDDFGISYIEGGWPGSNPRDEEFFAKVRKLEAEACASRRVRLDAPRRMRPQPMT